jgi:hypothetical protein
LYNGRWAGQEDRKSGFCPDGNRYSLHTGYWLAGSQQPLGVMRTIFTHVGAMGHVSIQNTKDMDTDMYLDTPAYLTSEFS